MDNKHDDMVAFLRARLDEDERDKQHLVSPAMWQRWLCGIEWKREILDTFDDAGRTLQHYHDNDPGSSSAPGAKWWYWGLWYAVVRLAAEYSTHPDYREQEWRPKELSPPVS